MRKYLLAILLISSVVFASAQSSHVDSLQQQLITSKEDTAKASLLEWLTKYYTNLQADIGFYYAQQLVQLCQKMNYPYGEAIGFFYLARALDRESNYSSALEMAYRCLHVAEKLKKNKNYVMSLAYSEIGLLNRLTKDDNNGIINMRRAVQLAEKSEINNEYVYHFYTHLAAVYNSANNNDSALFYAHKGDHLEPGNEPDFPFALITLGRIYEKMQDYKRAKDYYRLAIQKSREYNSLFSLTIAENAIASLYNKTRSFDSCIYYAKEALAASLSHRNPLYAMNSSSLLFQVYEAQGNTDSTLKYMKVVMAIKDSVFSQAKMQQYQLISFNEQQQQQQLKVKEEQKQNRIRLYALFAALVVFLLIAIILYRNNQQKQKAQRKIEKAYEELKATQAQLIQSEKMASLGELTAGIAHEIQNPLNFVNNFSEINTELIEELKAELATGNTQEAISIADDIKDNEQKINHHGKRADAIVKGMLQHSRASTGKKELIDINALADEYLRLSYHGFRAKNKDFNTMLETHFDEHIGKIKIIPQDIGRVLLNLYNNAFYSLNEKKQQLNKTFNPTVEISTRRVEDKVEISVRDNGMGIPQKVIDKIFQPFFTTKPTGQGTGLGLSLSYDIIKAHGGEIKVETKEGEGSTFIIKLSI